MKLVLFDNGLHKRFAPLSLTRPIGDLRIGIMTNTERWKLVEPTAEIFFETEAYLNAKFPTTQNADLFVNGALIPNDEVVAAILALSENEKLVFELLKPQQKMPLEALKTASELSNKAWDKTIKGLTKLQLVIVTKEADTLICSIKEA